MQYYESLINSLNRGVISPVYLFYGEETYLGGQAVEQFKKQLLTVAADFNLDVLDGEKISPGMLVGMASTPPLMAERRLVLVKNPPWFTGGSNKTKEESSDQEPDLKHLLDYLANPLTTTCLIFIGGENIDRRRKIFKLLEKVGQAINFTRLKPGELAKWLQARVKAGGKKIEPKAVELLVNGNTTGLTGLVLEWQKLLTYVGDREQITADDVKQVAHFSVEYRIFDVLDAMGARRYGDALAGIRDLLTHKEPPQIIMTMVARQFRLMLQVKELAARGLPPGKIAQEINEKPYPVQNALKLCHNFSREQLINTIVQLAQLDADIKSGRQEFYPGIETLLLSLGSVHPIGKYA